jgi:hypothetical protein
MSGGRVAVADFEGETRLEDCRPTEWMVVFHRESGRRWVKWLAFGRYQHVSAFAQVKSAGIWLFYEVMVGRTEVMAVPDAKADPLLALYARKGCIVRMKAPIPADDGIKVKPGLWCVPAVAHLLGLRTCALRPDALLRHCLANGGTIVVSDDDEVRLGKRRGTEAAAAAGGS